MNFNNKTIITNKDYKSSKFSLFLECTHCEPYTFFCNSDKCWEAKGLSARLIEKEMKQIKTKCYIITHPRDADDFERCYNIVTKNDWRPRLDEMKIYGIIWQRIINNWDELSEMLINEQKDKIFIKLSSLDLIGGHLKRFHGTPPFVFNRDYIIGSHLVQPGLQADENDLSPCIILDKLPDAMINYYLPNGKIKSKKSSLFNYPKNYLPSFTESPLINNILKKLDSYVKSNTELWYTTSFHTCPHFIFPDTLTDVSSIYFCQIYQLDYSEEMGYCLISIPPTHPLNPSFITNNNFEVEYKGFKWVVSSIPVKLNTLYMTDGLINACEDDIQINDLIDTNNSDNSDI
jgi:hypothetical protein